MTRAQLWILAGLSAALAIAFADLRPVFVTVLALAYIPEAPR